jgi:hypothetical protein
MAFPVLGAVAGLNGAAPGEEAGFGPLDNDVVSANGETHAIPGFEVEAGADCCGEGDLAALGHARFEFIHGSLHIIGRPVRGLR